MTCVRGKLRWAAGLSVDSDIQVIFSLVEVPYEGCKKRSPGRWLLYRYGADAVQDLPLATGLVRIPACCTTGLLLESLAVERFRSCCIE